MAVATAKVRQGQDCKVFWGSLTKNMRVVLLLLSIAAAHSTSFSQWKLATRYTSTSSKPIADWKTLPHLPTSGVIHDDGSAHLLSSTTLQYCPNIHDLTVCNTTDIPANTQRKVVALGTGKVALITPHTLDIFSHVQHISATDISTGSTIHEVHMVVPYLIVASSGGLTTIDFQATPPKVIYVWSDPCAAKNMQQIPADVHTVTCAYATSSTTCMAVTNYMDQPGMCIAWFDLQNPTAIRKEWSIGFLDAVPISSGSSDSAGVNQFWIATNRSLNVYHQIVGQDPSVGLFTRYAGGSNNLPASNLTTMATSAVANGMIVAGADAGLVVRTEDGKFDLLTGPRYLATASSTSSRVTFVAISPQLVNTFVVVLAGTKEGVSVLTLDLVFDFSKKALIFQEKIPRHIRPKTGIVS